MGQTIPSNNVRNNLLNKLELTRVLVATNQSANAQKTLEELINDLPLAVLQEEEQKIVEVIQCFFPKRRKHLDQCLSIRLKRMQRLSSAELQELSINLASWLRNALASLSDKHIFQWSTYYRDIVCETFSKFLGFIVNHPGSEKKLLQIISDEFSAHGREIFSKGYDHVCESCSTDDHHSPIAKSKNGLQRFLELPIQSYAIERKNALNTTIAISVRGVCSSMIWGILKGYGEVLFGDSYGWGILVKYPETWAHYLAFLNREDVALLLEQLPASEIRDGFVNCVQPVITAVDSAFERDDRGIFALPEFGEFSMESWKLDLYFITPKTSSEGRYIQIRCYMQQDLIQRHSLEEAANRNVDIIVAPLRADLRKWVNEHMLLRDSTVDTQIHAESGSPDSCTHRILELLERLLALRFDSSMLHKALSFNYARNFPLHNPVNIRFFRVHRSSVRELLRSFETSTGIRLWCSIRRSGKTTACFDLSSPSGETAVLTQTCESTERFPNADYLYNKVVDSLEQGSPLQKSFFTDLIFNCSEISLDQDRKIILVLDEYETLFERLRISVAKDRELRYTVVQPLLNQMVSFARENLIVLVGQRPDAHYIIMEQNQLSPYVKQDLFPLFQHRRSMDTSEFSLLLKKVVSEAIHFNEDFVQDLYEETGGHPYVTVNILTHFFEWLIDKHAMTESCLSSENYKEFSLEMLTPHQIRVCIEYDFFNHFFRQALSKESMSHTPWLYAVSTILASIVLHSPDSFTLSMSDCKSISDSLNLENCSGYELDYLIKMAESANFLSLLPSGEIQPRIRLMARISGAVSPRFLKKTSELS